MGVTDLQVLQTFKKGQLELFYRRIYPGLLLYAVKNAGDRHDFLAEDCVQNAIFNAWKRRDSFDSIYTLKSFLYTSVKNEIISLYRKGKAQERYSSQLENEAFFANTVIDQETQLLLFNAIHSLPDRERQIFELSFIEGLKNIEIAEQLGVSDSTVKKAKAKALEILREKLDPRLFLFFFLGETFLYSRTGMRKSFNNKRDDISQTSFVDKYLNFFVHPFRS